MIIPISFVLGLAFAGADMVRTPSTIPQEKGSIVVSEAGLQKGGGRRWVAEWTMEPWREKESPAVRFTEVGHGRYSPYALPISWSLVGIWTAGSDFRPLRFEKTITDAEGHTIATERKTFDQAAGTVRFERTKAGHHPETKQLRIPPDTLTVEGIAGILQFLPFENWRPFTAHLLTNDPQVYAITLELRGKERVRTSAGEIESYKIELVPQLGVLGVFRPFLRKAHFWFSTAAPHVWVRYEGPENGQGSPQVVMEPQN
jgi:hypothetical protein